MNGDPFLTKPELADLRRVSAEYRFSLQAIRGAFGQPVALTAPTGESQRLIAAVDRQGIAPLIRRGVMQARLPLSAEVDRALRLGSAAASLRLRHLVQPVLRLTLGALHEAGLEPVVLKGAALAHLNYPDPALRTLSDIDVLLPTADLGRARAALIRAGFSVDESAVLPAGHQHLKPLYLARGSLAVELHDRFFGDGGPFCINMPEIIGRARPATIAGVAARVLAPADALVYVCAHVAYGHSYRWFPLRTLTDILALTTSEPAVDWELVLRSARQSRLSGAVYWPLRLSQAWLGSPIPEAVLGGLAPAAPLRNMLAVVMSSDYVIDGKPPDVCDNEVFCSLLVNMSVHAGRSPRQQFMQSLRCIFPPAEQVSHLPAEVTSSRLRYAAYLGRLDRLSRGVRALWGLLPEMLKWPGATSKQ